MKTAALFFLLAASLHAAPTKVFVASYGNDSNDGSRGAPKRNFQSVHDAVAVGGQIVVLDTAGYGALSINKSLAVTVPPGVNGFVTVNGGTAINVAAGAGSVVSLRGLVIEGQGNRAGGGGGGTGIYASSVGALTVEDCAVRNFSEGIFFTPTNGNARLGVHNTSVRNCRYGVDVEGGNGIGTTAIAVVSSCRLENLYNAVYAAFYCLTELTDNVLADCDTAIFFASNPGITFVTSSNCKFYNVSNNPIVGIDNANFKIATTYGNNTVALANFNGSYSLK